MSNSTVLKFILMLSLSLLIFSACGDDDPTGPGVDSIVGVWKAVTSTTSYGSLTSPDSTEVTTFGTDIQFTLTINDDNTWSVVFVVFGITESDSGTWSVSGNTLTIKDPDEPDSTSDFSISGDTLTITSSETTDDYTIYDVTVFTRQ